LYTLEVHHFDASGAYRGLARRIEGAYSPELIARPGGTPLLLYGVGNNVAGDYFVPSANMASVLSTDLAGGSMPVVLGSSSWPAPAVFVGSAFLFAETIDSTISVGRIELDGTLVPSTHDIGLSWNGEQLALTSNGPVLLYDGYDSIVPSVSAVPAGHLAHLDEQGASTSSTVVPDVQDVRPEFTGVLGVQADVIVATTPAQTGIELLRIDNAGQTTWRATVASSRIGMTQPRVVQRGPDVVVGWLAYQTLGLAKIQP
jgi:hypothetical protein